jgi:hypothetical protein
MVCEGEVGDFVHYQAFEAIVKYGKLDVVSTNEKGKKGNRG